MNLFELVARWKLYLNRTASYLSILNFILIFLTFKKTYNINIPSIIIIPVCIILSIIIGWIDYLLIMPREIIWNNKQNDVKKQIDRIEKKLNEKN